MPSLPNIYRIALSPFDAGKRGAHTVLGDLTQKGFPASQLCLVGAPSILEPFATSLDPNSAAYPELSRLATNLEGIHASAPMVASTGPISDVLFKQQSWLLSPAGAGVSQHLGKGDVVLAVNALDHDQFVHAARLLLRYGNGNLWTHIFRWQ
jgi:hypothetical protein